jgi:hypothetical protein
MHQEHEWKQNPYFRLVGSELDCCFPRSKTYSALHAQAFWHAFPVCYEMLLVASLLATSIYAAVRSGQGGYFALGAITCGVAIPFFFFSMHTKTMQRLFFDYGCWARDFDACEKAAELIAPCGSVSRHLHAVGWRRDHF